MLLISDIHVSLNEDLNNLIPVVAKEVKLDEKLIQSARLYRKSVDARKKDNVHFCISVLADFNVDNGKILKKCKKANEFREEKYTFLKAHSIPQNPPVVVGFGPAGMFAALILAMAGCKPLVLERGDDAATRHQKVQKFV